ncbi:MAG: hypothetical protein ACJA06_001817 [Halocynthiibacter sp.]|jgi:hypothetical protein
MIDFIQRLFFCIFLLRFAGLRPDASIHLPLVLQLGVNIAGICGRVLAHARHFKKIAPKVQKLSVGPKAHSQTPINQGDTARIANNNRV